MCLGQDDCYCRDGEADLPMEQNDDVSGNDEADGHADGLLSLFDDDTTPDEDEEAALQREMIAEAGQARPDSIDWMRDGDTRHFYDETLPVGGDNEPY